jgi:hypothetical protein
VTTFDGAFGRRRAALLLAVTLACWGASWLARQAFPAAGLAGQYFSNARFEGPPAASVIDSDISTDRLTARWKGSVPPIFSVRWRGYLIVGSPGLYTFTTTSDDGSRLYVDSRLVVNSSGVPGTVTTAGRIQLDPGPHLIIIEYEQSGGPYELKWAWARDAADLSPVPAWTLSPKRISYATAVAARALDWLWWVALVAAAAAAVRAAWAFQLHDPNRSVWQPIRRFPRLACLFLFVGLTIVETWPLASDPARLSRNDNGDTILNTWIIAWVAHQAPRSPLQVFDGNIFYPERNTLTYSEAMLVQGAMAMPIRALGASPVLTYNLVLLAGFALTGWAMCLVMVRWTDDWAAGITAGTLVAFNAHNLARMPHLQTQHVEFFPLTLLAFDALLREPRLRHVVRFALWFCLHALTSYYLFVIATLGLAAAFLARPDAWRNGRALQVALWLTVSAGLSAIVLAPYLLPYWLTYHLKGFSRPLQGLLGAEWSDYVTSPARFSHWLLGRWSSADPLFPSFSGLILTAVGIATGVVLRNPRARMCLAFGGFGFLLSFGTAMPGYALLYHAFPALHGIRTVSRFGYLPIVAVGICAGFGLSEIRRRMAGSPFRAAVGVLIVGVAALELLAAPIRYRRFDGIPAIYEQLQHVPNAVVVELPMARPGAIASNAPYMLNSTVHWHPLLNGFSGFIPGSYVEHYEALRDFPSPASIAALRQYGVTHLFVHLDRFRPQVADQIQRSPALQQVAAERQIILYKLAGA